MHAFDQLLFAPFKSEMPFPNVKLQDNIQLRAAAPSSDSVGGYVFMWIVGLCCGWAPGRLVIRYMRSCESERMTWSHTKSLRRVELVFEGLCGQRT